MVSIPDGLDSWEDRSDLGKLTESILKTMPGKLEELIETINNEGVHKVSCVIADGCAAWAIRVAKKIGTKRAVFWPSSVASLAPVLSIRKLTDDGIIDNKGIPIKDQTIQLSPTMPPIKPANLPWAFVGDLATTKAVFKISVDVAEAATMTEMNWSLRHSASIQRSCQSGHYWQATDLQTKRRQFEELALGLELSNKPFLWVVRPEGHPSVACFLSHCGWNSTLEGVTNGVPFLCWPYISDQFSNQTYICDIWKNGLDEAGYITREEIKSKLEHLLSDKTFKAKAMDLKEKNRTTRISAYSLTG
ncbi:hypothetical protein L1987_17970 [Smallanthus sonchifolius]|uniref:Uncharacterized protein n=1 Tax=Smallanthus sonchifolius TaxID=185202 RepID=A0ACB9J0I6_9ASTR|nr:hypothetical protein L1987_17970 [Smallanthus sonchifolius]